MTPDQSPPDPIEVSIVREAEEQLEDAARTLASMRPPMATSVTSVHVVPPDEARALRAVADRLGQRYGLQVSVQERTSLSVRFSR